MEDTKVVKASPVLYRGAGASLDVLLDRKTVLPGWSAALDGGTDMSLVDLAAVAEALVLTPRSSGAVVVPLAAALGGELVT